MAIVVYALCALTALACAVLLLRGYRATGTRLLMRAGLCFPLLTVNNLLVIADLELFRQIDLFRAATWRRCSDSPFHLRAGLGRGQRCCCCWMFACWLGRAPVSRR